MQAASRVSFLFPTYLGRSKETLRAGYYFTSMAEDLISEIPRANPTSSQGETGTRGLGRESSSLIVWPYHLPALKKRLVQ